MIKKLTVLDVGKGGSTRAVTPSLPQSSVGYFMSDLIRNCQCLAHLRMQFERSDIQMSLFLAV